MDHLLNWVEIPVRDMKRAISFYRELLRFDVQEMKIGDNDYALFAIKNNFNTGCLVKGPGYVPRTDGVVVYLNGGDDLSTPLSRVENCCLDPWETPGVRMAFASLKWTARSKSIY